jgi:FKBP-type peptidyl-prolyl cis-trans isomerase FkpA
MRNRWFVFSSLLTITCGTAIMMGCGGAQAPSALPPQSYSQTDLAIGTGTEAVRGARLTVHYTGWLYDANRPDSKGKQFDSSAGGQPFTFRLGSGEVIPGWDQGFDGMRVGGKRRLILPPSLGYGPRGTPDGTIPGNAGLVFEMELLNVS